MCATYVKRSTLYDPLLRFYRICPELICQSRLKGLPLKRCSHHAILARQLLDSNQKWCRKYTDTMMWWPFCCEIIDVVFSSAVQQRIILLHQFNVLFWHHSHPCENLSLEGAIKGQPLLSSAHIFTSSSFYINLLVMCSAKAKARHSFWTREPTFVEHCLSVFTLHFSINIISFLLTTLL